MAFRQAVFLHTQKTAGTSIVCMAREHYGAENIISHGDWLTQEPEDYCPKPFISGHFGFSLAERFFAGRYSFTFLRDPLDRIISFYSFCRGRDPREYAIYEAASRLDIDQFIGLAVGDHGDDPLRQDCHNLIWNNQAWQLARGWDYKPDGKSAPTIKDYAVADVLKFAKRNLERFDFVGFTETFDEDALVIGKQLDFDRSYVPHENSSVEIKKSSLSSATLKAIYSMTEVDQEIYAFAKRKFRNRFRRIWNIGRVISG